jgi:hypothetical protein
MLMRVAAIVNDGRAQKDARRRHDPSILAGRWHSTHRVQTRRWTELVGRRDAREQTT